MVLGVTGSQDLSVGSGGTSANESGVGRACKHKTLGFELGIDYRAVARAYA
jgi:hypothetical protein